MPQQMLVHKGVKINNVQLITGVGSVEMSHLQNSSVKIFKEHCRYLKKKKKKKKKKERKINKMEGGGVWGITVDDVKQEYYCGNAKQSHEWVGVRYGGVSGVGSVRWMSIKNRSYILKCKKVEKWGVGVDVNQELKLL